MIDTLIYVMIVFIDTITVENRFQKAFEEADMKFKIEMMKQASHEAAHKSKTYRTKILDFYRKED